MPSQLDLSLAAAALTAALVDIPSVSGDERELADAVERALRELPRLRVDRHGNNVVARTEFGLPERVVLAGHLDTVPIADNLPSRLDGELLYGCGTTDMKSGVAVQLKIAYEVGPADGASPDRDLTFVFYDCEEIEAARNGLGHLVREHPDWLEADFAVLLEPTDGQIEGGCKGTMRATVSTRGVRAHSGRDWLGVNAIHGAAPVLTRLAEYKAREVDVEGLIYRECLNAVGIKGGVAGNVIPDECVVTVNYRFAPDLTEEQAAEHVRAVFADFDVEVTDSAPAAAPGLSRPSAAEFARVVGGTPEAKQGWTDVARFAGLGVPAVNYGPGDSRLAHTRGEYVEVARIAQAVERMRAWLGLEPRSR
ncbi:succinyl-diaminopimelate desuccinylase [Actinospica sp.]|jgi:succinyl-diaminopimelate desuccinylase|uniref:succinyl-diaminopimelate desuccinylase n=1 Tax=Actinospica sp. TaxID=1872142 RepID=UPI002C4D511D|nr:succinyl-diaminopimelate desuccinylase [Actinospica sp.]HWG23116.1 succinyl-diaminopimelate desuccinylase [Actinospica sp.]